MTFARVLVHSRAHRGSDLSSLLPFHTVQRGCLSRAGTLVTKSIWWKMGRRTSLPTCSASKEGVALCSDLA